MIYSYEEFIQIIEWINENKYIDKKFERKTAKIRGEIQVHKYL